MKVLFSWYDFLIHDWFVKIIRTYLKRTRANEDIWHFERNNIRKENEKRIVWTNESRCWSLDYELFYRKYDKIFYLIRNPIDAMINYYLWIDNGENMDFIDNFVKCHMIEYITHYKCHLKLNPKVVLVEEVRDNFEYFCNIMNYIDNNLQKNILYNIYSLNRPRQIDRTILKKSTINLIKNIWEDNDLTYEWKK